MVNRSGNEVGRDENPRTLSTNRLTEMCLLKFLWIGMGGFKNHCKGDVVSEVVVLQVQTDTISVEIHHNYPQKRSSIPSRAINLHNNNYWSLNIRQKEVPGTKLLRSIQRAKTSNFISSITSFHSSINHLPLHHELQLLIASRVQ
jgi:hypothetical protein